ncbi:hypothetical protein R3P38DRAFT_1731629 [Favolaschia claudopus]|uniref:Histone H4 n=1 Tax=Favolaschia claudopus TaxID=2862362 RepID=A0AAW0A8W7_9AGAR
MRAPFPIRGGAKSRCCRRVWRDRVEDISKPEIRRLARSSGVKRTSNLMYAEIRGDLKAYLHTIAREAIAYSDHRRRDTSSKWQFRPGATLKAEDVACALRRRGGRIYGYDF